MVKCIKIDIKGKGVISERASLCTSMFSQARGLMFSLKRDLLFTFKKEDIVPLHMLFVFFPICAIFLDSKFRIVEKAVLLPFTVYSPRKKAKHILEISINMNSAKKAKIGDVLRIKSL
ncbi:MAG: DUF192 domain-containing protein [Candidatus Woesearchaeota archaeon]|nr:DUF192 domain-containing protein [Candidatus Woesearchaeota archaeon]